MSLHYPPLDELSTTKVFKLNLALIKARYKQAGRKIKIDEDEILHNIGTYWRSHEKARWNGRQIRNACQTALALAEFDAQPPGSKYDLQVRSDAKVHLKLGNVETVSNAYLEFMEYLKAVRGTDSETYAKESGLRARESVIVEAFKKDKHLDRKPIASHGTGQKEKPLRSFQLKTSDQTQQGIPASSMAEQPYSSQPESQRQVPAHSGSYDHSPHLVIPQGGMAPNITPSNFQQPPFTSTTQGQFHQHSGHHSAAPPQHGSYSLSSAPPGLAQHDTGANYPVNNDPRGGGGSLHERGGSPHWNESYPAADPTAGNPPGQNAAFGRVDYDRSEHAGRGHYQ